MVSPTRRPRPTRGRVLIELDSLDELEWYISPRIRMPVEFVDSFLRNASDHCHEATVERFRSSCARTFDEPISEVYDSASDDYDAAGFLLGRLAQDLVKCDGCGEPTESGLCPECTDSTTADDAVRQYG